MSNWWKSAAQWLGMLSLLSSLALAPARANVVYLGNTLFVPDAFSFNSGDLQYRTILRLFNPNPTPASGTITYYDGAGTQVAQQPLNLAAWASVNVDIASAVGTAQTQGNIIIQSSQPLAGMKSLRTSSSSGTTATSDPIQTTPRPVLLFAPVIVGQGPVAVIRIQNPSAAASSWILRLYASGSATPVYTQNAVLAAHASTSLNLGSLPVPAGSYNAELSSVQALVGASQTYKFTSGMLERYGSTPAGQFDPYGVYLVPYLRANANNVACITFANYENVVATTIIGRYNQAGGGSGVAPLVLQPHATITRCDLVPADDQPYSFSFDSDRNVLIKVSISNPQGGGDAGDYLGFSFYNARTRLAASGLINNVTGVSSNLRLMGATGASADVQWQAYNGAGQQVGSGTD